MSLTDEEVTGVLTGLPGWHLVDSALRTGYDTADRESALALLRRVVDVVAAEHRLDIDLRGFAVHIALHNGTVGTTTQLELTAARRIAAAATELGATARPAAARTLHVAIDTVDAAAIRPFWREALGYVDQPRQDVIDLVDPGGSGPRVWFQTMDPPRTQRSRTHLDVYVPLDEAEALRDEVIAAGGTLRDSTHAPDWWVLADAEGNEVCLCTAPP